MTCTRYFEEGLSMNIIKKIIQKSESINRLPMMEDIITILKEDNNIIDIDEELNDILNELIEIGDGTEIEIVNDLCFKSNNFDYHDKLYYIPELEQYICMECGTRQKYYSDIFIEVRNEFRSEDDYNFYYEEKLLPSEWSDEGVRKYFKTGIKYEKDKNYKYDLHRNI